jgi:tRNA-splicing ligase RtcB
MDLTRLEKISDVEWRIPARGEMRVPGVIFATEALISEMDDKVFEQVANVAKLPGIVRASYAMPDAHWGYGFPFGGVAAFDPKAGGVVSAGGVGFDVSCGVRTHLSGLTREEILSVQDDLASALFDHVPTGLGAVGDITLDENRYGRHAGRWGELGCRSWIWTTGRSGPDRGGRPCRGSRSGSGVGIRAETTKA